MASTDIAHPADLQWDSVGGLQEEDTYSINTHIRSTGKGAWWDYNDTQIVTLTKHSGARPSICTVTLEQYRERTERRALQRLADEEQLATIYALTWFERMLSQYRFAEHVQARKAKEAQEAARRTEFLAPAYERLPLKDLLDGDYIANMSATC